MLLSEEAGSEEGVDGCWVGVGPEFVEWVGQRDPGSEEMTLPLKPSPANRVLVTTEATVAWPPLDGGPIPVAIETKEKGSPAEVQVDEPELIGAMSAEDAGETVG